MTRFVSSVSLLVLAVGAGVVALAAPAPAAQPPATDGKIEDGVYAGKTEGEGRRLRTTQGAEVILGPRLGNASGQATIRSLRNDNAEFQLDLKNAGPLAKPDGAPMLVVLDGVCLGVWAQSDRNADGTMRLACTIHGEEAARKVAARLKVEPQVRTNPGHRFEVRWSPEKESYKVGESMVLKMHIRNVGDSPLAFMVGGQQRGPRDNQYRFLAYRGRGLGKAVPDTGEPMNFGGIATRQRLDPGEAFTALVNIDKWFAFTEPDTYRITGLFRLQLLDPAHKDFLHIWDDLAAGDCLVRIAPRDK